MLVAVLIMLVTQVLKEFLQPGERMPHITCLAGCDFKWILVTLLNNKFLLV